MTLWPPLSDRGGLTPDLGVGIDTISLRGPVDIRIFDELPRISIAQTMVNDRLHIRDVGGGATVAVGEGTVRVFVGTRFGQPPSARIEFSAPTLLYGHNRDVARVEVVPDLIRHVLDVAADKYPGLPPADEMLLTRCDVTRDINEVESVHWTLARLALLQPRRPCPIQHQYGSADGGVQTLVRGVERRWRASAYDKSAEMLTRSRTVTGERRVLLQDLASDTVGRLRFEVRLFGPVIRENDLRSPSMLALEPLGRLARQYFHHTGMDMLVSARAHAAITLSATAPADRRGVVSLLACEALGIPNGMSHNTLDRYRRTARALGLTADNLLADDGEPRALDFERGRELRGDDALAHMLSDRPRPSEGLG